MTNTRKRWKQKKKQQAEVDFTATKAAFVAGLPIKYKKGEKSYE